MLSPNALASGEDDYDAEFRYDRQARGAVQGLDPGRVAHVGTVSKTPAPGCRVGWVSRLVEERTDEAVDALAAALRQVVDPT